MMQKYISKMFNFIYGFSGKEIANLWWKFNEKYKNSTNEIAIKNFPWPLNFHNYLS